MILPYMQFTPDVSRAAFIAESADIIGQVELGEDVSVWFQTVIRGDLAPISIGRGSNIQDSAVIHMNHGIAVEIGERVSIAHQAMIHGCRIGSHALIGMRAVVMDGSVIGEYSLVAAGSLVPPNKHYPPKSLILGSPARAVRTLADEEIQGISEATDRYIEAAHRYRSLTPEC